MAKAATDEEVTGRIDRRGLMARRALLITGAAGLLSAAGCTGDARGQATGNTASTTRTMASTSGARLAALERRFNARLGVYATAADGGPAVTYNADERFAMCSTYKVLAAAAVLHRDGPARLDQHVSYGSAELVEGSPVTAVHLATGMTLRQLCQAAVSDSDNTAGNLLLRELGGPAGVTAYARSLGDRVTRLDRTEPYLNQAVPGDIRDTASPRAIGTDCADLVLGTALTPANRSLLTQWLVGSTTGAGLIRAAVPAGWMAGDKTGTGRYGTANDVAIVWPPRRSPIVVAIMSTRAAQDAQPDDALVAQAAGIVLAALPSRS